MKKQFLNFCFLVIAFSLKAQQDWKLSVQMWTFHKSNFLEALDKAKQLGFQYIEAYPGQKVGEGLNGPFSYNLSQAERKKLRKLLKEKGI